jgi:hypothetical protein
MVIDRNVGYSFEDMNHPDFHNMVLSGNPVMPSPPGEPMIRQDATRVPMRRAPVVAPKRVDTSTFGKRPDGTAKGTGFLGVLKRPDSSVSTEISVGVPINGREMDIPTLVPGLTSQEVNWLLTTPVENIARSLPNSIRQKAVAHAQQRIGAGLSPFKQDTE